MNMDIDTAVSRLPPHSDEAEKGVLSCIIQDPKECLDTCIQRIGDSEMFYDMGRQKLYSTMLEMQESGLPIGTITLNQRLKEGGNLESVGGITELMAIADFAPSKHELKYYLDTLIDKYTRRKIINFAGAAAEEAFDETTPLTESLDKMEVDALAIRQKGNFNSRGIKDVVAESIDKIEELYKLEGSISGISTGFSDFDRLHDGLHEDELLILAGYPGSGKTVLMMNLVEHLAVNLSLPVLIYSFEMSDERLMRRMICSMAKVDWRAVRDGRLSERDFPKLTNAAAKLSKSKIIIRNPADMTIGQMRADARRENQKQKLGMICVDYLQLVTSKGHNRENEVATISHGLKAMNRELKCPVLALSQLTDDGKLRESRAIGQDADSVLRLRAEESEPDSHGAPVSLLIDKQRNGPCPAKIPLVFLKAFTRMEQASPIDPDDYRNQSPDG